MSPKFKLRKTIFLPRYQQKDKKIISVSCIREKEWIAPRVPLTEMLFGVKLWQIGQSIRGQCYKTLYGRKFRLFIKS
jgi:hypothetical protein